MTDGAWFCLICDTTGAGPNFDSDAERHTKASGHGTSTCLAGGPFARARRSA